MLARPPHPLCPDITLITAITTYQGKVDFDTKYPSTYYRPIGSRMEPCDYGNACYCEG